MVKLVEVPDEHFEEKQTGPADDDDAYYTDTDSSISDSDAESSADDSIDETLLDRITALKEMISPKQRTAIQNAVSSTYGWITTGLGYGGKTLWVLSTSALLLGVPYVLAVTEEQQMIDMEKEMKMQQNVNDLMAPGTQSLYSQQAGQVA